MLSPRKVVITQRFFDEKSIHYLESNGCEVVIAELPPGKGDGDVPVETLLQWLDGAAGWILGHARVTRELLGALPALQAISRRGVGYERVDTEAVTELGRVATIAAGGNDATVADQAVGMMLALGRRFREGQANVAGGSFSIPLGTDLYGKTVGVIGAGRIGEGVLRRLKGFDVELLVSAPRPRQNIVDGYGACYVDLPTLLSRSDYVSLHAPLTAETRFMIRDQTIRLMKPDAFIINTARGGLVEDRDLLTALKQNRLAGAGLDVFMSEADASYADVTLELAAQPNVVAQPHSGASTREGLDRTNMVAARCVVAVLDGGHPPRQCLVADGRGG